MKEPDREEQAKKIIKKFKEKQPNFAINSDNPNATNFENIKYFYCYAFDEKFPGVRNLLKEIFPGTK